MSDSVRPHRRQPTRLPRPWDSPGKNTGVGCHCLLQCIKVKSEREVAQSCPTLRDPMDCSLPSSSVHGICQARVLDLPLPSPIHVCRSFEVSNLSEKLCGFVQRSVLFSSVRRMTEMNFMYFCCLYYCFVLAHFSGP